MKRFGGEVTKDFVLSEKMIPEEWLFLALTGHIGGCSIPPPIGMSRPKGKKGIPKDPDEYFFFLIWDIWCHLIPFLKNELGERSTKEQPYKSTSKEELFKMSFDGGTLKLHILKPWAAELLGLSETYTFQSKWPFDVHMEIINKFPCRKRILTNP